jgi:hypothetical protein
VKNLGYILGAIALALAIYLALRAQRTLETGLPPRIECAGQHDALVQAGEAAVPVAGTGSMAPYIPAAAPGRDAIATIVAYAKPRAGATFADIKAGDLVIYRAAWNPSHAIMHQAAQRDAAGWIMSGLHNSRSESWERVTAENFRAIIDRVYVWPQ